MSHGALSYRVLPSATLSGALRVPGDKSMSHRAVMFGALADGVTEVDGFLPGADCLATLAAFRALGVSAERPEPERLRIEGVGIDGLEAPDAPLDMGNSGTAMRLLAGILAGQPFSSTLTGDASLNARPMRRVTEPLARMGARIDTAAGGTAPLLIHGRDDRLRAIDYPLPMASAQVKSCVLLAGLYADGVTSVTEPGVTRDHTERMLAGFGYPLDRDRERGRVALRGGGRLRAQTLTIPGDISSAAFFLVGASLAADGPGLRLSGVGVNPTRDGVLRILELMGADIRVENRREHGGEPVADLYVRPARLRGITVPEPLVPLAIDEFPALFVAAAAADGDTVLTGAEELRVKETDRIQAMADGLAVLGVDARPTPDGVVIRGRGGRRFGGGRVDSRGDHRIAMAFAIAALAADAPIDIDDCANVATSFPNFVDLAAAAGLRIDARG